MMFLMIITRNGKKNHKKILSEGVKYLEKINFWGKVKENNEYKMVVRDYGLIPNDV